MSLRPSQRVGRLRRTWIRRIFDAAPPDAIQLGLGQPDLTTPDPMRLAGVAAIAAGQTGYTTTAGDPALRRAVAEVCPGAAGDPQRILITVGSQEALFLAYLCLVDPGREVLYPDPGYPAYPVLAELAGGRGVPYPLRPDRGFRLQADDVLHRVGPETALVVVSAPANPTGACPEPGQLKHLVEGLRERGVAWVSDEVYGRFCYGDVPVSPGESHPEDGLVVGGLSKDASMTGWRIGWLAGPQELVQRATALHQYVATCAPSISQAAARAAFGPQGLAARDVLLERFRTRRDLMRDELARVPGIRFEAPDGAFYYFVDTSVHGPSMDLALRLIERCKVVTVPGSAFGPEGEGYLRISFAASEDAIRSGIRRIAAELGS